MKIKTQLTRLDHISPFYRGFAGQMPVAACISFMSRVAGKGLLQLNVDVEIRFNNPKQKGFKTIRMFEENLFVSGGKEGFYIMQKNVRVFNKIKMPHVFWMKVTEKS
jgi:hypothetical protein